ncbi:MAG: class I SAM-dependent methyltransferase [Sedimentisphaerales bacterium]|nr:class I SAM-dependent methyltransferase [Sedimentisphaerales bacterium]
MRTCRRTLLDKALNENISLMQGRVLDIGGVKAGNRGRFRPPKQQTQSWEYVNINPEAEPDYCCDASRIHVEGESYDTIIMTELLEYVESPSAVLEEAFRILKYNGHVLISVPFLCPIHGDWELDRQRLTETALVELVKKIGFKLVSIEAMGSLFSVRHDICYAAFSYAAKDPQKFYLKLMRMLLRLFKPFCLWVDAKCLKGLSKYINTGYFLVLIKAKNN